MAYLDLRQFISILEKEGELHRIKNKVDWNLEIGNIMWKVYQSRGPAILFENVKDSNIPILSGALAGLKRYAMAIQVNPDVRTVIERVYHAMEETIEPIYSQTGPCKENIEKGKDINLFKFPVPKWHHLDGGRYIGTLGVVITKDPDTGIRNMAIVREQLLEKDKIGLLALQDTAIHLQKYRALKKPMPVATVIGAPPAVLMAAGIQANYGVDEVGIAGALAGERINLVECESIDLQVPADAEIVLEGQIYPDESTWTEEGPFGEFFGYTVTGSTKRPTINITAVTYRNKPIFQGTSPGVPVPPNEDSTLKMAAHSASVRRMLIQSGVPGVKEVYSSEAGGVCHMIVVSMDRQYYLGNARQVIDTVWGTCRGSGYGKWVIVVDDDINIFDREQVEWALATRVQPHRDIVITDDRTRGVILDPSIHPDVREYPKTQTSRIGIDATREFKGYDFPPVVRPTPKEIQELESNWGKYGFK